MDSIAQPNSTILETPLSYSQMKPAMCMAVGDHLESNKGDPRDPQ